MKDKTYLLSLLHCALWFGLSALFVVIRTVYPAAILPPMDLPLLLAVSLIALLLKHWIAPNTAHSWLIAALLAAPTFALLPLCADLVSSSMAGKLAVAGSLCFAVTTILFDSMLSRLSSGPKTKGGAAITAFLLFLAGQCLTNLFF